MVIQHWSSAHPPECPPSPYGTVRSVRPPGTVVAPSVNPGSDRERESVRGLGLLVGLSGCVTPGLRFRAKHRYTRPPNCRISATATVPLFWADSPDDIRRYRTIKQSRCLHCHLYPAAYISIYGMLGGPVSTHSSLIYLSHTHSLGSYNEFRSLASTSLN